MKITDFENEDAIDLLADCIDPISEIFSDEELKKAVRSKAERLKIVKIILKNHKKEIIEVFARMHNTPVEEYKCNVVTITRDLLEILNDKELTAVFTS